MRPLRSPLLLMLVMAAASPLSASRTGPMNLEPLRMVTDWLNNVTNGVNALLPGVPRDGGDALPPTVQLIVDETRNGQVARDRLPTPATPGPVITLACIEDSVWGTALETTYRECDDLPMELRYADLDKVVSEVGTRNAYYTIRAVMRSLKLLMSDPTGTAARTRDSISLVNITDRVVFRPAMKQIEDKIVVASIRLSFGVQDNAP